MRQPRTIWKLAASLMLMSLLLSCDFSFGLTPSPATGAPVTTLPAVTDPATTFSFASWLQIYFTDPSAPSAGSYEGGIDVPLAKAIDAARLSVDVAAYDLNLWSIRDALVHAEKRGVVVRMVMESDNMDNVEVQDLKDAGIPILGDQREGLMHDKFMVIDRMQVWTGSLNYTVGGTYKDNNNLISIRSQEVAEDYTREFEEMFSENRFGPDGKANTPFQEVTIDGTQVEVYFSPDDGVAARIVELINGAAESVHFMAYSFTSNDIGTAMVEKAQAGLTVNGVMDESQSTGQGTEYDPFKQAGLDVRLDGNVAGLMHHKVILIDDQIVITGSYNFTASAEDQNDENLVIIYDPGVTAQYLQEFQRVFEAALP
jgi:phosphatidylserine/phosphatidylglycerophosphate/cardiolipin synthase-like enzyme